MVPHPRLLLASACVLLAGCSSTSKNNSSGNSIAAEQCDATKRPILFVHGIMGGGDNFELQAQRFTSNGYCRSAIRAYDYDGTYLAFGGATQADVDANQARLDAAVDAYLSDTGFDQIDLVGHSFGTATSAIYLSAPEHAAKIAHYVQAAGGGVAEPVPQVNLSSDGDFVAGNPKKIAPPGPNGESVENPDIGYVDHVAVLTTAKSFAAMYQLFNGEPPKAADVIAEDHPVVSGFYKDFSDNTPHIGIKIDIYQVNADTGARLHGDPDFEFVTDENGAWGPFVADPTARYEFFTPEAGEPPATGEPGRPQHTYRAEFRRSTHLMYLKALPKLGSYAAGIIVGKIPYTDNESGFIVQNSHRAMISKSDPGGHGTDSLTMDGNELLSADVAPEKLQLVALFGFDNGQDPYTPITTVAAPFFLSSVQISLPTSDPAPVALSLNGSAIHIPRWKSDTEGSSLVLMDQ